MKRITALTFFAISASALLARSPMLPKYIGWGGPGETTFKSLITLIHPFDITTGTVSRAVVIVDDRKPFLADFPFLAKVRVTVAGKSQDYDLAPLNNLQVNHAAYAGFYLPTVAAGTAKLEFLRGRGRGAPQGYNVDPQYTKTVNINTVLNLAGSTPTDPDLQRPKPLHSETSLRLPVTVLEVGKSVTLSGRLAYRASASAPNIRVRGYPVIEQLVGKVVRRGPADGFVPVEHVAVMGGDVDIAALTSLLGRNVNVTVTGRLSRIYYVVNTGGPTEAVVVESVTVRGKQLPQDLPLTVARLKAVASQLVENKLGAGARVKSVSAQNEAFLYTVTVVNARQQLRYYQVDVLDKSVRELNVL